MIGLGPSFFKGAANPNTASLALASASAQRAVYGGAVGDYSLAAFTAITLEQWVNHATSTAGSLQGYQGMWANNNTTSQYGAWGQFGNLRFAVVGPGTTMNNVGWAIVPPVGGWAHYAFVWDGALTVAGGAMKLFVNGVDQGAPSLVVVADDIATLNAAPTDAYTVGDWSNAAAHFDGKMDEVRVWSVARTGPEILADYQTQIDPATPNLFRYFRFNSNFVEQVGGFDLTGVNAPTFSPDVPF